MRNLKSYDLVLEQTISTVGQVATLFLSFLKTCWSLPWIEKTIIGSVISQITFVFIANQNASRGGIGNLHLVLVFNIPILVICLFFMMQKRTTYLKCMLPGLFYVPIVAFIYHWTEAFFASSYLYEITTFITDLSMNDFLYFVIPYILIPFVIILLFALFIVRERNTPQNSFNGIKIIILGSLCIYNIFIFSLIYRSTECNIQLFKFDPSIQLEIANDPIGSSQGSVSEYSSLPASEKNPTFRHYLHFSFMIFAKFGYAEIRPSHTFIFDLIMFQIISNWLLLIFLVRCRNPGPLGQVRDKRLCLQNFAKDV